MAVVRAVGIAVGRNTMPDRASKVEAAMQDALVAAQSEGVTDPAELRKRMIEARDRT